MSFPTFEPLLPSSLWLALAIGAAALLTWYALRRPGAIARRRWFGTIAMMAAALLIVLLVLLNPTWVEPVAPPAGKPVLTILVDATASMNTPDGPAGAPRYQAATDAAARATDALGKRFEVHVKSFSDAAVTTTDATSLRFKPAKGMSTDLAGALAGGFEPDRPAGQAVLLLSDGIHNAGGGNTRVLDAVRVAKALGAPIYTKTFGGQRSIMDIAVEIRSPQDLSFVKQKVPLTVRVKSTGVGNTRTDVVLFRDQKEVARHTVELTPAGPSDVHFMIAQDKPGLYPYEVQATPLPGEISQANNSASYLLRVVDEPIRVLVLEGKPYWDSKFLTRTLAADPAVALDLIVKLADNRFIRRTLSKAAEPTTAPAPAKGDSSATASRTETWKILTEVSELLNSPDRLKGYQIVVLGRDAEIFLTDAAVTNLQNWVSQEGGSLVCYRGAPTAQVNQKLAKLLPVKWTPTRDSRLRVKLTDQGKDLQWVGGGGGAGSGSGIDAILAKLPMLATSSQVDSSKALAVVLATAAVGPSGAGGGGNEMPAIVYQPYGSGRVVCLEGAGMWRWAFLPPASQQHDQEEVYGNLWHSLLRWLISGANLLPGQKMTLRTDKVSFNTTDNATVTLMTRDEGAASALPQIELLPEGADKPAQTVKPVPAGDEPGTFRVGFGKLTEGRYQARIAGANNEDAGAKTLFDVKLLGEEQLNLAARPDLMKRIAQDSGGAAIEDDNLASIENQFNQHMEKTRPAAIRRTSAWDRAWVLIAVLALWGITWALRRSGGLV
jgi:hypothetical protein